MSLVGLILIPPIFGQVLRNDFSGAVGYRFKCVRDITIVALGRFAGSVFAQSHVTELWTDAAVLIADVVITPSSPLDLDGYGFGFIPSVSLFSGQFYRVATRELDLGDNWLSQSETSASLIPPNTSALDFDPTAFNTVWGNVPPFFPVNIADANVAFGKPQLYELFPDVSVGKRFRAGGKVRRPGRRR